MSAPDDQILAALIRLARDLPDVDADEARRRLQGLTPEKRRVVERVVQATAISVDGGVSGEASAGHPDEQR